MIEKLLSQGKYDEIVNSLEGKSLDADGYVALGLAYYMKGNQNKAISNFKRALSLNPHHKDALFNLSEIFLQLEKFSKAKGYALKLLEISPDDWAVHDILSECYKFEGFYDKSLRHLSRAIDLAPDEVVPNLKAKLEALKERVEKTKYQKKLAIICAKGLDNFIDDIIKGLKDEFWVQRWTVTNSEEIKSAIDWAEIVWLEWANEVAIIGSNYGKTRWKRTLIRLHSYEIFTDFPLKINWYNVDDLIFVAPHIEEIFFERFPKLRKVVNNTEVVFNGLDLEKIPFKDRKPGYDIAWVAHINYKKAPELSLQVIKKLVEMDSGYRLHIAGDFQDPRYEVYMKHLVRSMDLKKNVLFYGWVDDMEEFWKGKNYLLSTSLHEGHPYNIMEAMARGIKPIVHWFRGAEKLYDKQWLFFTIDEAVNLITSNEYDSRYYRNFLKVKKFTLRDQVSSIRSVLDSLNA